MSIHPKVKDFDSKDETNYEIDEINKENTKDFCIFIADRKSENRKHETKYDKQTLWRFCQKKNEAKSISFNTDLSNLSNVWSTTYQSSSLHTAYLSHRNP